MIKVVVGILIAAIFGVITNVVSGYIQPTTNRKKLFISSFFAIIALSIALAFLPDCLFCPKPEIQIVQPREGEEISRKSSITGTSKNVPEMNHLWLYVYAPLDGESGKGKYYLAEVIDKFNDGKWNIRDHIVGIEQDKGAIFRIGVLLADAKVHKQLKLLSQNLDEIPEGEKFSEISVRRR
jgi:hypothetical protein